MNTMMKPVSGHCNIDCNYCFYKKGHTYGGHMSEETLVAALDRLSIFLRGEYPFVFQGGEPLLAGYEYFENLFQILHDRNLHPPVMIQTNGTLLDDRFAELFARNQVLIGVSLDGTELTHQSHRSDFSAVMAGIDCLKRHHCDFNILTVVTDELCQHFSEVYEFYRKEGFEYQQYIPCMTPIGADPYQFLSDENYGDFLVTLYDLWSQDLDHGRYVYIRYFENLLQILAGYQPEECGASGICSQQFLVESDGSVYPCDFYVEDSYYLGNLHQNSIDDLSRKLEETHFIANSRLLSENCRHCSLLSYCRGGCKRYRNAEGKYLYCNAIKKFLRYALNGLKKRLMDAGITA